MALGDPMEKGPWPKGHLWNMRKEDHVLPANKTAQLRTNSWPNWGAGPSQIWKAKVWSMCVEPGTRVKNHTLCAGCEHADWMIRRKRTLSPEGSYTPGFHLGVYRASHCGWWAGAEKASRLLVATAPPAWPSDQLDTSTQLSGCPTRTPLLEWFSLPPFTRHCETFNPLCCQNSYLIR
jgi:hypothetical protein